MACLYNNWEGECSMYDKEHDTGSSIDNCPVGWDIDGYCVCEDDPNPYDSCESYEEC